MKVKELKDWLSNLDEDFEVEVTLFDYIPIEERNPLSPYPYNIEHYKPKIWEVGYSDRVASLTIYKE